MTTSATSKADIPLDLLARKQWILWVCVEEHDHETGEVKLNKKPYSAHDFSMEDWLNPTKWQSFVGCEAVLDEFMTQQQSRWRDAYVCAGIGYVFSPQDGFAFLDLDHCLEGETLAPWAAKLVDTFRSYTQVSCSGTGLHILIRGKIPGGGMLRGGPGGWLQVWDHLRYVAMTGHHWPGTPKALETRQAELEALAAELKPSMDEEATRPGGTYHPSPPLRDEDVLQKCRVAKNHQKFTLLWRGEWAKANPAYASKSEGDAGLLEILAFYTQDFDQLCRLFEQSALCTSKWLKRVDYRQLTIGFVLRQLTTTWQPGGSDSGLTLPWSDYTNALAFVREHGDVVRYCYVWKKWLVWNTRHWEIDTSGMVLRMAKDTVKRMAARLPDIEEERAKAYLKHVKDSLSIGKLKAMVEMAQSEPGIAIQPDELDTHGWLLNVANGTLDLRTGFLVNHHKEDYLTVCLSVAYSPDAPCLRWEQFLGQIMGGSLPLIGFLQRMVGYSLSGVIREHILPILYGKGRNGKSTFLNTIRTLLGPYAMKAGSELLLAAGYGERHPTERADLAGKRFVCASETDEGRRLAEAFIKDMTGGEPLRVRRMHEDFWEFQPTHKTWLATNHKPTVKGTDDAVWTRIKLIPFEVRIPDADQDTTLGDKLLQELPGILSWAVQGCLIWQATGLAEPEEVRTATQDYKEEEDVLGAFIKECCLTGNMAYQVAASDLYAAYTTWGDGSGTLLGQIAFGKALRALGYDPGQETTGKRRRYWRGIGLRPETNG